MKKIILIVLFTSALFLKMQAQIAGTLDSTFGVYGKVITDASPSLASDNNTESILLQTDGKIIAVGWFHTNDNNNYSDFSMMRYLRDGSLDSSFGTDGIVIYNLSQYGSHGDFIRCSALQQDGKILVAGSTDGPSDLETVLARFNTNGAIDSSFGTNGITTMDFVIGNPDEANGIALQEDGKIIVGVDEGYVSRFNTNGIIDSTFGTNGVVAMNQAIRRVAVQADGKVVAAGEYNTQAPWWWYFGVMRLKSNGDVDSSFGTNGRSYFDQSSITTPNFWSPWINGLAIEPDGKIVIGGGCENSDFDSMETRFAAGRLNIDGSLDSAFGTNGVVAFNLAGDFERIHDITLQPDGKIFFVGEANNSDFAIVRTDSKGTPDSSFNTTGILLLDFYEDVDYAYASVLQPDGKLLIDGPVYSGSKYYSGMARLLNDFNVGTIDLYPHSPIALCYPNPVKDIETLEYILSKNETVTITLFDSQGRYIMNMYSGTQPAGKHLQSLAFPPALASGNYLIDIATSQDHTVVKIVK